MKLGITGTRMGWSEDQKYAVLGLLKFLKPDEVHHGNCVGVDEQFKRLCFSMRAIGVLPGHLSIVCHPPLDRRLESSDCCSDVVLPAKTYLARNRDIVNSCDSIIVVPLQDERQSFGGTWYTYDYAHSLKKWTYLILRDGTIVLDNGGRAKREKT